MKDTKTIYVQFSLYDRTGIKKFLEKQAVKGWLLTKISALSWHFSKINPKKLQYSVVYYSKASAFDPEPTPGQLAFRDFCEHTGWKLAATNAQMQIFYNISENPTPIETDANLEISSIHKSAKKGPLISLFLLTGVGVLQMILFIMRMIQNPIGVLSNNANLYSAICFIIMIFISAFEIMAYYKWYKKAKSLANLNGSFLETKGYRNLELLIIFFLFLGFILYLSADGDGIMTIIAIAIVLFVIVLTAMIVFISEFLKKIRISAKANRNFTLIFTVVLSMIFTSIITISIISNIPNLKTQKEAYETYEYNGWTYSVYNDKLPLKVEDLNHVEYDKYSYELISSNESYLLSHKSFAQYPRKDAVHFPDLEYSITTIKAKFLYDFVKEDLLKDFAHNYGRPYPEINSWEEHIKIDPTPWGANEAYQLSLGGEMQMRFILCYDEKIVEIDFPYDFKLTQKQLTTIAEVLGN